MQPNDSVAYNAMNVEYTNTLLIRPHHLSFTSSFVSPFLIARKLHHNERQKEKIKHPQTIQNTIKLFIATTLLSQ